MTQSDPARNSGSPRVEIRAMHERDRAVWRELFAGYGEFYHVSMDEGVLDRVWGWLMDGDHPTRGMVAARDGEVVGFAHFRTYPRTLSGNSACFLDDLFVAPAARGHGVGRSLIGAVSSLAEKAGWDFVRWVTARDNHQAQRLYDSVAEKTGRLIYQLTPGTDG